MENRATIKIGNVNYVGKVKALEFLPSNAGLNIENLPPIYAPLEEMSFSVEIKLSEDEFNYFDNLFDLTPSLKP